MAVRSNPPPMRKIGTCYQLGEIAILVVFVVSCAIRGAGSIQDHWADSAFLFICAAGSQAFRIRVSAVNDKISFGSAAAILGLTLPAVDLLTTVMVWVVGLAVDLRYSGHSAVDIFRIHGFNLVLLPINLAGVLKSMQQALTGEKTPFARTPKISGRTAAPGIYVAFPIFIVAFSAFTSWLDFSAQTWGNAAFAAFNAVLCAWAIMAYIGTGNAIADMALGVVNWLYVDVNTQPQPRTFDPNVHGQLEAPSVLR